MRLSRLLSPTLLFCAIGCAVAADRPMSERIGTDADGHITIEPLQEAGVLANPWPAAWEAPFAKRRAEAIAVFKGKRRANTTGEHEKWGYPTAMGAYFAGDRADALGVLQEPDLQGGKDHAHTLGIDLYWCFTIKGQMRKYFDFGHELAPDYHKKMTEAINLWTQSDPRPSLEYVNVLQEADGELKAFVLAELTKMWRNPDQLRAMADEADKEEHPNKKRFAAFIRQHADTIGGIEPGDDAAQWMAWWRSITAGGWMIFEEYERRTNPNPHPKYGIGKGPVGATWNPEVRGMRADARNTDNLRGMRECAVYLFAEASGNEVIRQLYKARLKRTVYGFWGVGNGEWDSEGYLGHTMSAYINLYDFAKDPEVRAWGKAIMDFLFTSAAVKYRRGSWGGPLVRDYGNRTPWSTSAHTSWYYYGEADAPHHPELELPHFFSSSYRPPAAVVALAKKQVPAGTEIFASHPNYENFLPGNDEKPVYHETTYFGKTFQLGTMVEGHGYNRNGFKLLVDDPAGLVDYVIPTTGKPKNPATSTAGGDIIGQHGNGALYLNRKGGVPFHLLLPKDATVEDGANGAKIITVNKTWIAVLPHNLKWSGTQAVKGKHSKKEFPQVLLAGAGDGIGVIVGDAQSHGDLAGFKAAMAKANLTAKGDQVVLTFDDGRTLGIGSGKQMFRDGEAIDWEQRKALWQPAAGGQAPLSLGWKERKLRVEAGGHLYEAELKDDGAYVFTSTLADR